MANTRSLWRGFLARRNDDRVKVFGVALLTALASAVLVSVASVTLQPLQDAHLAAERSARMAAMLDTLPGLRDLMEELGVDALETRLVDLETGVFVDTEDSASFDLPSAETDPALSTEIPSESDIARLGRRATLAPVHLLQRDGEVLLIVLPVSGKGYQSTIRATLALNADLRTVAALTITEQGETPGPWSPDRDTRMAESLGRQDAYRRKRGDRHRGRARLGQRTLSGRRDQRRDDDQQWRRQHAAILAGRSRLRTAFGSTGKGRDLRCHAVYDTLRRRSFPKIRSRFRSWASVRR